MKRTTQRKKVEEKRYTQCVQTSRLFPSIESTGTSRRRAKNIRDTLTRARNFSREEILPSLVKAGSGDEEGSSAARRNRKLEERNFIRVRGRSVRRGENVDVCSSRLHLDDCVRCHSFWSDTSSPALLTFQGALQTRLQICIGRVQERRGTSRRACQSCEM